MKKIKIAELMSVVGMMTIAGPSSTAFAQDYGVRNGGDVLERRFNEISGDLREWILKGGAQNLHFPEGVQRSDYEQKMLSVMSDYSVSFTNNTIVVNEVEKDCQNIPEKKIIECNIARFKGASESDQYVIVHHEYAGLAGIETNDGKARSNYLISSQISSSLEKQVILKLAVKKEIQIYKFDHITIVNKSAENERIIVSCEDEVCSDVLFQFYRNDQLLSSKKWKQVDLVNLSEMKIKVALYDRQEGSTPNAYEITNNVAKKVSEDFNEGYVGRGIARGAITGLAAVMDTVILPVTGVATLARIRLPELHAKNAAKNSLALIQRAANGETEVSMREKSFSRLYPLF